MTLQGHVALVTGAGAEDGIGFACARELAARGASVAVTATTERIFERATALDAWASVADLTDEAAAARLVGEVVERFGRLDVLVNNAGMAQTGAPELAARFVELGADEWRASIERTL